MSNATAGYGYKVEEHCGKPGADWVKEQYEQFEKVVEARRRVVEFEDSIAEQKSMLNHNETALLNAVLKLKAELAKLAKLQDTPTLQRERAKEQAMQAVKVAKD